MVPTISIVSMTISLLLNLGLVIFAFIFLRRKFNFSVVPIFIGALSFVLFALVLGPLIMVNPLFMPGADGSAARITPDNLLLFVLLSTLASGLFEETGRLVSFLLIKKRYRGIGTGISYGIGHGGIEVLALVVLTMLNNIILSLQINSGSGALLGAVPNIDQIAALLVSTPPYMYLVAFAERIPAMVMHISWSVMVWYAVNKGGKAWLLYPGAIVLHMIANTMPALAHAGVVTSVLLIEIVIYVIAAGIAALAVYVHKRSN
ncbi:MAG: YhfC family intramembrane metalloprotease [Oscillospiraceae bacterium]|nr:YhfC family intramembrane metalloprotease [Oscillospiraceae bacterium]